MPNRCFFPHFNRGYPEHHQLKTKCSVNAVPKDENGLKPWNQAIPRLDTQYKTSSKVCSHHFVNNGMMKGRMMRGKHGPDISCPWNNWTQKEGGKLFSGNLISLKNLIVYIKIDRQHLSSLTGCPAHLNKRLSIQRRSLLEEICWKKKHVIADRARDAEIKIGNIDISSTGLTR